MKHLNLCTAIALAAIYCSPLCAQSIMTINEVTTGGKLLLNPDQTTKDPDFVKDLIKQSNTILCVPSYYRFLLDEGLIENSSISKVILAGEKFNQDLVSRHYNNTKDILLYNEYGPTENTVWTTVSNLDPADVYVTIGKPVNNTKIYITDEGNNLCAVNVPGEICIGGGQVARGYLNRFELTQEKFIKDSFVKEYNARIYKTGDIGRWLPDGNIQYLGRKDDQVKIRGYRIELGEIESVLHECRNINQGVVLAREDINGNKQLIGYVVPKGIFDNDAIVSYLKNRLPEYMIPALWIELPDLPLTPNGKIDKKSLPDFYSEKALKDNYVAPRNDTEKMIAEIWEEVLAIEKVGINNNFFELGGHSLLILKLASKVRKLGVKIEIKDFFKYQTIEQQSNFIKISLKLLQTASEGRFVIPIQPEGNNIPLFAIPEFLLYSELGKHISKNQPFYSIEHSPYETVPEVVNHYITEIKKAHPKGPYGLMGYCGWGDIILEIAQTLIAQGDEVPVLVLTECYSPKIKLSKFSKKFIRGKTKFIIDELRGNISLANKSKFLSKQFAHILEFINRKFIVVDEETRGTINKRFTGKVILFQASQTYGYKDDSHMGWSEIFTGEVKKFIIEGDHLAMMASPIAAAQIAEILNTDLIETIKVDK